MNTATVHEKDLWKLGRIMLFCIVDNSFERFCFSERQKAGLVRLSYPYFFGDHSHQLDYNKSKVQYSKMIGK